MARPSWVLLLGPWREEVLFSLCELGTTAAKKQKHNREREREIEGEREKER